MIASRLVYARERLNMTQEELGEKVGAHKQQVYRWEKGINIPSSDVMARMAEVLAVTSDYLLGLVDEPDRHFEEDDLSPIERQLIIAIRYGTPAQVFKSLAELTDADTGGPVAGEEETVNG